MFQGQTDTTLHCMLESGSRVATMVPRLSNMAVLSAGPRACPSANFAPFHPPRCLPSLPLSTRLLRWAVRRRHHERPCRRHGRPRRSPRRPRRPSSRFRRPLRRPCRRCVRFHRPYGRLRRPHVPLNGPLVGSMGSLVGSADPLGGPADALRGSADLPLPGDPTRSTSYRPPGPSTPLPRNYPPNPRPRLGVGRNCFRASDICRGNRV